MEPMSTTPGQRAYDYAKWAILSAVYPAGSPLDEEALAAETGLDVAAAHDALVRLEADGLVRVGEGGVVVSTFTLADVEDVLEARVLVENHTASRSFDARKALLPRLLEAHEATQRNCREHDTAAFTANDRRFHELIVDAAGNSVLSEVYRMLRERQTLFTSVMVRGRTDRMQGAIDEHERIIATLRGDDRTAFTHAVNAHLRWSIALARESL